MGWGGEGGRKRGGSMATQTLPGVEQLVGSCGKAQGAQLREQGDLEGRDGGSRGAAGGGDTCTRIADSHCGSAESNPTLSAAMLQQQQNKYK